MHLVCLLSIIQSENCILYSDFNDPCSSTQSHINDDADSLHVLYKFDRLDLITYLYDLKGTNLPTSIIPFLDNPCLKYFRFTLNQIAFRVLSQFNIKIFKSCHLIRNRKF